MSLTVQSIEVASNEGRKFLRRVLKESRKTRFGSGWKAWASESTDWCFEFEITLEPSEIGEPEQTISVRTDVRIRMPSESRIGKRVQAFSDSQEVFVYRPKSVRVDRGDAKWVAKLMLEGASFELVASAGSTSSSKLELSFYYLTASLPDCDNYAVRIGNETVATTNRGTIISGPVSI